MRYMLILIICLSASTAGAQVGLLEAAASATLGGAMSTQGVSGYSMAMRQNAANQIVDYSGKVAVLAAMSGNGFPRACNQILPVDIPALVNVSCSVTESDGRSTLRFEGMEAQLMDAVVRLKSGARVEGNALILTYDN